MKPINFSPTLEQVVSVPADAVQLAGELVVPAGAQGVVLLAHNGNSRRDHSHCHYAANILQQAGLATLLLDWLTPAEAAGHLSAGQRPLNTQCLADRIAGATAWLRRTPATQHLGIGYLGIGSGSAAVFKTETRLLWQ